VAKLNDIPSWSKGVISIVIAGAGAFALFKLYKYLSTLKEQEGQKAELTTTEDQLKKLKEQGKSAGITRAQVDQIANKLQTAINGYGTHYNTIYSVLIQIKNEVDLLNVRKAYGIRKVNSGSFNFADDFSGTLDQTMVEELSQSDIQKINLMLAKKGISNRF